MSRTKRIGVAEQMRLGLLRLTARLRERGTDTAHRLADRIQQDLASVPARASIAAQSANIGPRLIQGRLFRVTPGLAAYMYELLLVVELGADVAQALAADPELADLKTLLF